MRPNQMSINIYVDNRYVDLARTASPRGDTQSALIYINNCNENDVTIVCVTRVPC